MKLKSYPEYKDSGIKWIGKIPEEWAVHRIKSFVPYIKNGQWGDDSSGGNNDFIVLRVADFLEFNFNLDKELTIRNINDTKLRLKEGDLVIEKSGGGEKQIVGRVVQLKNSSKDKKYTYSNFIGKLDISNRMNKTFLNYYFKAFYNNRVNFNYIKQTTGIQNLDSTSLIQREYFAYPTDKNYQKSIVSFLDKKIAEIDELIEKDKKLIELLKEKRTALINHAVTKGLPVRCTQTGLDPNANMKDSGIEWIGKVPEGWKVVPLLKFLESKVDYRGATPEKVVEGVFLVTGRNIKEGKIDYELSQEFVPEDQYKEIMHRGKPQIGDLLFTTEAPLGEVANVDNETVALAQRIIKMRGQKDKLNNYYLKYYIMTALFQRHLQSYATGSTALGIKASNMCFLRLIVPFLSEQLQIVQYLNQVTDKIDKTIQKIEQKINLLEEYKKSLIHHAVTGKIDVRVSEI